MFHQSLFFFIPSYLIPMYKSGLTSLAAQFNYHSSVGFILGHPIQQLIFQRCKQNGLFMNL